MINTQQTQVKLILACMMEKVDLKSGEVIAKEAAFHSKTEVNLESTDSNELISKMKETVFESLAKFHRQGSNWRFHSVLSLDLHTVKYVPLGGSSYIPLPKFLAAKKAMINLKNEDDECFKCYYTSIKSRRKNPERIDKRFEKNQRSSIGMVRNFQSILVILINLKITILQFLLMYSVMKNWFILLE